MGSFDIKQFEKLASRADKDTKGKLIKHAVAARSKEAIKPEEIIGGKGSSFLKRSKEQLKNKRI